MFKRFKNVFIGLNPAWNHINFIARQPKNIMEQCGRVIVAAGESAMFVERIKNIRIKETDNAVTFGAKFICEFSKWLGIQSIGAAKVVNVASIKYGRFRIQSQSAHKSLAIIFQQEM